MRSKTLRIVASLINERRTWQRKREQTKEKTRDIKSLQKDQRRKWDREETLNWEVTKAMTWWHWSNETVFFESRATREVKRRWNKI